MKLLSFAATVCLAAFPALFTFANDDPVRTIPELTLKERIVDLLEAVEDEAPAIYRRMADLPREEALARIMRALDSGVVPASAVNGTPGQQLQGRESDYRQYSVFGLTDRMFPYLRFDVLTRDQAEKAAKELTPERYDTVFAGIYAHICLCRALGCSVVKHCKSTCRKGYAAKLVRDGYVK